MKLPETWDTFLGRPFERSPHHETLEKALAAYENTTVYPPQENLFAAFEMTPPERVRVVILGQDPYHEAVQICHSERSEESFSDSSSQAPQNDRTGAARALSPVPSPLSTAYCPQANGLAFSVSAGVPLPPSLRNIYKELAADLGVERTNGDLSDWAEQGVLLLNTVLTVEAGKANSHRDLGWQVFTDDVIAALSRLPQPIAVVLWGAQAQKKRPLLQSEHPRLVLESPHPSPLSAHRGFFGSRPFGKINAFLTAHGEQPIRW